MRSWTRSVPETPDRRRSKCSPICRESRRSCGRPKATSAPAGSVRPARPRCRAGFETRLGRHGSGTSSWGGVCGTGVCHRRRVSKRRAGRRRRAGTGTRARWNHRRQAAVVFWALGSGDAAARAPRTGGSGARRKACGPKPRQRTKQQRRKPVRAKACPFPSLTDRTTRVDCCAAHSL